MYNLYFDSYEEEDKDRIKYGLKIKSIEKGPNKSEELENMGSLTLSRRFDFHRK
jgi:hypothetical protein